MGDFYSDVLQIYSLILIVDLTLNHLNIKEIIMTSKSRTIVLSIFVFFCMGTASEAAVFKCTYKGKAIFTDNPSLCLGSNSIFKTSPSNSTPATTPATPSTPTPSSTPTPTTPSTKPTTAGVLTDSVFAPSSFWYQDISKAPIDANSAKWTAEFIRQRTAYYGNVNVTTNAYTAPVYIVDSTVKPVKMGYNNCMNMSYTNNDFMAQILAVPIPSYSKISNGTDSEFAIYQPSTNSYWDFWQGKKNASGSWSACWGGKITNTKLSDGVFPGLFGASATGLPFIGGQITAEELSRGEIKHAIGISLVDLDHGDIVSWPAHRSDGWNPNRLPNRIAEGQRFRLDPTINVDTLNMPKAGKVIAKAAQKYGFVVWDHAGGIVIRARNSLSYTALGQPDPYPQLFENQPSYAILANFPWSRLQFLPRNYGKP